MPLSSPGTDDFDSWTDADFAALAEAGRRVLDANPHLKPTADCPPFPEFLPEFRPPDFADRYAAHFATGCPYCARRLGRAGC